MVGEAIIELIFGLIRRLRNRDEES